MSWFLIPRLLYGAAGFLLVVVPSVILYGTTVPVPQYRTGTFTDYQAFVLSCLTIYGGVIVGIAVRWRLCRGEETTISSRGVFRSGVVGGLVAVGVALALVSLRSGLGNLWGLVVIFGGVFATTVSGGAGLAWYAIRPARLIHNRPSIDEADARV